MKSERTVQLKTCKIGITHQRNISLTRKYNQWEKYFPCAYKCAITFNKYTILATKISVCILTIYTYKYVPYYTSIFEPYYHHYYDFFYTDENHPRLPSALNYFRILWELRSWVCSHDFFNNSLPIQFFLFIRCCIIAYKHTYTHALNAPLHPYKWCRSKMSRNLVRRGAAN